MILFPSRHGRFLLSFGLGLLVGLVAWVQGIAPAFCALTGVNAFFLLYLVLMASLVRSSGPAELRKHAEQDDEGALLIVLLALMAVVVSVAAIILVFNWLESGFAARAAALATLPLGWATIHMLAAFHYAHLYYHGNDKGLTFAGKAEPGAWDFLYLSFTVGMTAQVSDVVADSTTMRRMILLHGVASFFYNTGILALAVNAVVTAAA
ncbi:DUF1345 domain-containing protein [Tabrizicola sp.]|uniref:DUF1345 domain-containing protein n=1 Tax=Tabrizicola sp. TaxID=2005166 RepID=UPI00286C9533|nr:DUF1345 domain-containing protein [Tabrizicola sp.]